MKKMLRIYIYIAFLALSIMKAKLITYVRKKRQEYIECRIMQYDRDLKVQ